MNTSDVSNLVNELQSKFNTGLSQTDLSAIVIDYAQGDSDALIASDINSNAALLGYQTVTVNQVDAVISAIESLVGAGSSEATTCVSDHIQNGGDTPVSSTGVFAAIGNLIAGPAPSTVTTGTGGVNVTNTPPASGVQNYVLAALVSIAVIILFFLILKGFEVFA